jgi:site-specific recombinase XerD
VSPAGQFQGSSPVKSLSRPKKPRFRSLLMCLTAHVAIIGVKLHPRLFRHTMAYRFLADNQNDLVGLAQILGRENLNTTAKYTKRTGEQLADASKRLNY